MKKEYIKPGLEIIEIEIAETLMSGSDQMGFGGNTEDLSGAENFSRKRSFWDE